MSNPTRDGGEPRQRLRFNPIMCKAHGVCIELLPELITADPWGYPVLDGRPVPPRLLAHAKRAVQSCPTLALLLIDE
ncbi:ferredoxin [Actinocrinis puniceicyclus]|uniref:Ferredoxin n=1 Tax=Actinocrinis puniceicyclus TaxID=977794 RepID=A0A8J8BFJ0_9ACTN|nr:ferredoxin [Actinocrinis puniceicyclus]MBS2966216.1 ferredoxin [Actinocrinis puniceicyclus]